MGRGATATLLAIGLALFLIAPAKAHASLVRSVPPAGALLEAAPQAVVLEFSEALDPAFSTVQLFSGNNQVVNAGPGVIDPAALAVLRLALDDLSKDSYTAVWKVRSTVDGHAGRRDGHYQLAHPADRRARPCHPAAPAARRRRTLAQSADGRGRAGWPPVRPARLAPSMAGRAA